MQNITVGSLVSVSDVLGYHNMIEDYNGNCTHLPKKHIKIAVVLDIVGNDVIVMNQSPWGNRGVHQVHIERCKLINQGV